MLWKPKTGGRAAAPSGECSARLREARRGTTERELNHMRSLRAAMAFCECRHWFRFADRSLGKL